MIRQAYIAGRYTGTPDEVQTHILVALRGAARAAIHGFLPIIPHTMGDHRETTWDQAMDRCRQIIRSLDPSRDILLALPNWQDSRGAREEVLLAEALGIKVVDFEAL